MKPRHGYLTEPEWFTRNDEPEAMASNLAVVLVVIAIVALAGWLMVAP